MNISRKLIWSSLSTASTVGASLIINKIFAVFFGPSGITLLAHLQNLIAILITVPQEGINRGLLKYLPGADKKSYNAYLSCGLVLQSLCYLLTVSVLFLFLRSADEFESLTSNSFFVPALCIALAIQIINFLLQTLLQAAGQIGWYAFVNILFNITGIILVYFGGKANLYWSVLGMILAPAAGVIAIYPLYSRLQAITISVKALSRKKITELFQFVIVALSVLVFGRATDYFVRSIIIDNYDLTVTGYWQAAVKISDGYSTLFNGIVGLLYFTPLAQLVNERKSVNGLVQQTFRQFIPATFLFLIILYFLRRIAIYVLLDTNFYPAEEFITLQIIGDLFKFPSWLLAFIALAKGHTKTYTMLQLGSAVIYILCVYGFTHYWGLIGTGYAHIFRYALYLLVLFWLYKGDVFQVKIFKD